MAAEISLSDAGKRLRAAFQAGKDSQMLDILMDEDLIGHLARRLRSANDRALTYSAPQIADLAVRLGHLTDGD
jgi:hypothetical protein